MKQRQRKATRISPFAQFFGRAPRAEDQGDDDLDEDRKQRDDESDEDYARRMESLDDDTKDPDDSDKDDPDAEDPKDPDDSNADDLKDDPDAEDPKDPDDDEDDDEDKPSDAKKARSAERKRCAAIVAHGVKLQRTLLACSFAFGTNMTALQAKAALDAAQQDAQASKPRHRSLGDRMASVQPANPGANGGKHSGNAAKSLADRIVAVGERVRQK